MPDLFLPASTAVVLNPVSGGLASRRKARRMADRLAELGCRICPTQGPGQAASLARQAVADGATAVIAFGGDGTLYEMIAELPTAVGIGFFPTGTVNLFAHGMNIPLQPDAWFKLLQSRHCEPVYLGRCNDRPFACVASIAFDALVVKQVNRTLKKWIQKGAYMVEALRVFAGYVPPDLTVTLDGQLYQPAADTGDKLIGVIIGRVPYYGGLHPVLPNADPRARRLVVALLHARSKWGLLKFARGVLLGSLPQMQGVVYQSVESVRIESTLACPVALDGDSFGDTPVDFTVEPAPRWVLAPA